MASDTHRGVRNLMVSVRLTPDQVKALEMAAAEENLTVSRLLRRMIGSYLTGRWDEEGRSYRRRAERDVA